MAQLDFKLPPGSTVAGVFIWEESLLAADGTDGNSNLQNPNSQ